MQSKWWFKLDFDLVFLSSPKTYILTYQIGWLGFICNIFQFKLKAKLILRRRKKTLLVLKVFTPCTTSTGLNTCSLYLPYIRNSPCSWSAKNNDVITKQNKIILRTDVNQFLKNIFSCVNFKMVIFNCGFPIKPHADICSRNNEEYC